ncbi:hypothetical protein A2U01_0116067, partial [Trifolium medium]|nr:hypothetical protein [Trifolium medium]
MDAKSVLVTDV